MPLLSRKKPEPIAPEPEVEPKPGGKNKATPKRAEARASRPVTPYLKGPAKGARRSSAAGGKAAASGSAKERRQSMMSAQRAAMKGEGDPRDLPERDKRPEAGFVRDYVDNRRNLVTLVLAAYALMLLTFVFGQVTILTTLLITIMFVALVDAFVLAFLVRRELRKEFPSSKVSMGFYAFQRAMLPRRMRMPRPGVGVGYKH